MPIPLRLQEVSFSEALMRYPFSNTHHKNRGSAAWTPRFTGLRCYLQMCSKHRISSHHEEKHVSNPKTDTAFLFSKPMIAKLCSCCTKPVCSWWTHLINAKPTAMMECRNLNFFSPSLPQSYTTSLTQVMAQWERLNSTAQSKEHMWFGLCIYACICLMHARNSTQTEPIDFQGSARILKFIIQNT